MAYKPWKLPSTTYPSLSSFLFVIWNVPQGFPCLNTWSPMVALFEKVTGGEQWCFYRSPDPLPIHSLLLEHKHVINLLLAPATMLFLPQYPSGTIYKSCLPEVALVRIFFGGSGGHSLYWWKKNITYHHSWGVITDMKTTLQKSWSGYLTWQ